MCRSNFIYVSKLYNFNTVLAVIQLFARRETFNFDLVDDEKLSNTVSGFQLLYLNKQDKRSKTG